MTAIEKIRLEADLTTAAGRLLVALPDAARGVYCRDNIADPQTPVQTVAETVLYHFDAGNQQAVAKALGTSWAVLRLLLVGFAAGYRRGRACADDRR